MTPTQAIEIQLTMRSGSPLRIEGVLLEICFFTDGNYRYGFVVGKTDSEGRLRVSFDDIERCRVKSARDNLMDYNTPPEACDPTIQIAVPSDQGLRERVETVMRFYRNPPEWASPWPANGQVKSVAEEVVLQESHRVVFIEVESKWS